MKRFHILLWALLCSTSAHATTFFIRHDGGTNVQCTGTTNAAYPGSGTGQPCAYNHPYQMIDFNGNWIAFTTGDTMQFTDPPTNTTPYQMGEQNGGIGTDWHSTNGNICPTPNSGNGASSCILPPLPNNTSIIGQNYTNCHTPGHTGLLTPTILSGISWAYNVLDLQGTSGVTISCIEITQPDNCNREGVGSGGGCSTSANIVSEAGIRFQDTPAVGPTNLIMQDVMVAGLSTSGIHGSYTSGTIAGTDVYIWGNGNAGIDSDGGSCGTSCESAGTWNYSYLDVEANGCVLIKPFDNTQGPTAGTNAFNNCFGQNTSGYGDGFVIIASGALTVNVSHSTFKYNTQDGFDGLHISDDVTTNPVINITDSWSEGNAGQAIKIGTGAASTAINNVTIANCHILTQSGSFPNNPPGWITLDYGDSCRAAGNQWAFQMKNGSSLTLKNNTVLGYGTTMFDLGCASLNPSCGSNGATVTETNDLHMGFPDPGNSGRLASGWFLEAGAPTNVTASYNLWYNMYVSSGCPDSVLTGETHYQCGDPLLVSESNVDALNPNLTSGSPAIANGTTVSGISPDYNGVTRPNPPAIGFVEYGGLPQVATPTISPNGGTFGSPQTVTLAVATSFAIMVYTTDGSIPAVNSACTVLHGTTYALPFTVSVSSTVEVVGCKSGYTQSAYATATFTIGAAAAPTASPGAGTYATAQSVTLATTTPGCGGYIVWNTTNAQSGGNLTGTSSTNPLPVNSSRTVYAQVQSCPSFANSTISSFAYIITPAAGNTVVTGATMNGVIVQ